MNTFNATFDFATIWPTWKFAVECLTVLISYHPRPPFNFEPSFSCELELKNHSRKDIFWQRDQYNRKAKSDSGGQCSRQENFTLSKYWL